MADTAVAVTAGSGTNIDTRTEATNGNHRQVVVLGDPSTNAGVAPVDATKGLAVDLTNTGANTNKLLVTPDLPSGASTAAKQPALGTAGTPSADVISVQGIASMTALKVDGSAVTQPVSIASVPSHAVTNAGTFVVQENGAALTALQLIDDAIYTDGSGTVTKGVAILGQDGTNPQAIKTDASGELQVDVLTMPTVAVTQSGTWDEVGINDSGNSITVDYATTGSGTATGALRVELPTNGTGVIATVGAVTAITNALPAGTNAIGKLAANSGVDIGDVDVTSISAGTNLIGDVDIQPRTTGGWSVGNFTTGDTFTALTSTAQVIKGSAGKFGGYYIYNPNATATYVILYDIAAASVTVGTSTPKLVFCIPATAGANLELLAGIPFGTAMSIAATTTGGGNTAPSTALEAMIFYR